MGQLPAVLKLEVETPRGHVLTTSAESVQAPSVRGAFTVLAGHLPLLAALRCGVLHYKMGATQHVAAIGPGFVEAEPDRVEILTDMYATPEAIDLDAVHAELAEAVKALASRGDEPEGPEYSELLREVEWCHARIEACELAEKL
ncbi:MAG: ATP synthase F1 subunit epsilon [Myxococcales bacterium]|nr:ATP synthase F1 subunit epsilon [Myxococcales bacterium]